MAKMKPTLLDVAEKAGVSRAAVSLTLREHPKSRSFSAQTVRRIREAANELGYRTDFFASQSGRPAAQVLMLYQDTLQDLYSSSISESFQQQAASRGYLTMMSVTQDLDRPIFDERVIGEHGISAVALVSAALDRVPTSSVKKLLREGVRVIVVGRDKRCDGVSEVSVDDYRGGWLAAEHVYGLGARNVWLMGQSAAAKKSRQKRRDGVTDFAREHDLPAPELIENAAGVRDDNKATEIDENAYRCVKQRLADSAAPPDAIIANLDLRALGVYRALYEAGLQPGRDVAVIGYDDIWPAHMVHPTLTTIRQPMAEMGRAAADLLIDSVENRIRPGRRIRLEPELIIRNSTTSWKKKQ